MITASNQIGHEIQAFCLPHGWQAIPGKPLPTRDEALQHMQTMPKEQGVEYRVYAALERK